MEWEDSGRPNVFTVADYVFKKSGSEEMSNIRLQLVLFLAYEYCLFEYGEYLYDEPLVADDVCPVDIRFKRRFFDASGKERMVKREELDGLIEDVTMDKFRKKSVRKAMKVIGNEFTLDMTCLIHQQARSLEKSTGEPDRKKFLESLTVQDIMEQEKRSLSEGLDEMVGFHEEALS